MTGVQHLRKDVKGLKDFRRRGEHGLAFLVTCYPGAGNVPRTTQTGANAISVGIAIKYVGSMRVNGLKVTCCTPLAEMSRGGMA